MDTRTEAHQRIRSLLARTVAARVDAGTPGPANRAIAKLVGLMTRAGMPCETCGDLATRIITSHSGHGAIVCGRHAGVESTRPRMTVRDRQRRLDAARR